MRLSHQDCCQGLTQDAIIGCNRMQQDAIIGLINKDVVIFLYLDLMLVTKLPHMYYTEPYRCP